MMRNEDRIMHTSHVAYFFATKDDLLPGLNAIESGNMLKYVLDRRYESRDVPCYNSAVDVPDFGLVHGRRSPCYLTMPRWNSVRLRRIVTVPRGMRRDWRYQVAMCLAMVGISLPRGEVWYAVSNGWNPSSIVFAPGGLFEERTLLSGEISTILMNKASVQLFLLFRTEILRGFSKIKSFYVGPEAQELLRKGFRLTIDAQASRTLDLKP
jgi:hypothetical protein